MAWRSTSPDPPSSRQIGSAPTTRSDRRRHAEQDGQPQRLHADVGGARAIAGAHPSGDPLGGAVGEEVGADDDERQHGGGQRQSGELRGAEASDDRRVDEHVERLDRQRAEGGDRQRHDPAVGGIQEPTDADDPRAGVDSSRQQPDRRVGALERLRGDRAGLVRPEAEQPRELGRVVEQLGVAPLDRLEEGDDGLAGVGSSGGRTACTRRRGRRAWRVLPRRGSRAGCSRPAWRRGRSAPRCRSR